MTSVPKNTYASFQTRFSSFYMRIFLNLILFCALPVLTACQNLVFFNTDVVYLNPRGEFRVRDIYLSPNDRAKIHLWDMGSKAPSDTPADAPVIYYLHGNSKNMSQYYTEVTWLIDKGFRVIAIDYQGFGESEGKPRFPELFDDALLGFLWIKRNYPDAPVHLYGQSMGGAIVWGMLEKIVNETDISLNAIESIVVEGSFWSLREVAMDRLKKGGWKKYFSWVAYILIPDRYSPRYTLTNLDLVGVNVLQMHSEGDGTVDIEQGRKLGLHLPSGACRLIVEEKTHISIALIAGGKYQPVVERFLRHGICPP